MTIIKSQQFMYCALNCIIIGLSVISFASPALGQVPQSSYPGKSPIRIVAPFAPGGSLDYMARLMAKILDDSLGHTVLVENRPGAGGSTGSAAVAKAEPDGHTFLYGAVSTHAIAPHLRRLPYDALRDFTPITVVASVPLILVVHPSVPVYSVRDLLRLAKAQPGKLNFGSAGVGSIAHLTTAFFMHATGIKMIHVPYKGAGQFLVEIAGGQIDLVFGTPPSAVSLVRSGRLRAIAVSSAQRSPALPKVPTITESGVPGFEVTLWWALYAPARLPQDILTRVNGIIVEGLRRPDVRENLKTQGVDPIGNPPDEAAAYARAEWDKWSKVVAATGIKLD
ncbi:MAG: hypothetical protein A3G24_05560 [Betaproteobacteria bacterium RIFCSPLOWO2_12_FULL_62_13]|nr:MAG: hypothetical protein A3G24_05560 [Betaproteobacteria bacterium RIFCSPLOWO2_12_FULL_62_13]